MVSTQATTVTETRTLVLTLAVLGALGIAAAFFIGWKTIDEDIAARRAQGVSSLAPTIVELPRS